MIFPALATTFGTPASWLLEYMISVAQYVAQLSWAQTELPIAWPVAAVFYVLLTAACFYMWQKTGRKLVESNIVE